LSDELEDNTFVPDFEDIYDYLVNKSNEMEYEIIIIQEIIKRLEELRKINIERAVTDTMNNIENMKTKED